MEKKNKKNGGENFKVIILGEAGVGKTSLIRRYTRGNFSPETTTTVGVDRIPIRIKLDGDVINFQVLDTAGCFGFHTLIKSYVNTVDAVIFVYDLTNKETFACLPLWKSLMEHSTNRDLVQILVGNKRDLSSHREVQFKNAKHYADFEGMVAMEVSVKDEESVDVVFQCVARELLIKNEVMKMKNIRDDRKSIVSLPPRPKSADLLEKENKEPFSHLARKFRLMFKGSKSITCSKSDSTLNMPTKMVVDEVRSVKLSDDLRPIRTDYLRWF